MANSKLVYIDDDLVKAKTGPKRSIILAFGDPIEILKRDGSEMEIRVHDRGHRLFKAKISKKVKTREDPILHFSMVDVQQGDGMIIQTPKQRKLFIDGGDNKLFARFCAARYPRTTADDPLEVDALIITHGDADHYAGLSKMVDSEKETGERAKKRIFLYPKRVFHNGLVKGPSRKDGKKVPDEKMFGPAKKIGNRKFATGLVQDVTKVSPSRLNAPFKRWVRTLKHWGQRGPIDIRRLAFGDDNAFDFLADENIKVEVHGPITQRRRIGSKMKDVMELLKKPEKTVEMHLEQDAAVTGSTSASHTINGHSIVLRLIYGNVRFYLTGDLNQQAMDALQKAIDKKPEYGLQSEIIKAPHHGSADFDFESLKAMQPVVSLISSGDESARKEHIHPRATLVSALGKVSRGDTGIVLCTELAAFFEMRGYSQTLDKKKKFFGFERKTFGMIQVRTDGERVLVFTHSARENMKEAYRFRVDKQHRVNFEDIVKR